jgi:hypothetical protein
VAKKMVASQADLVSAGDKRSAGETVKFVSTIPEFHFTLRALDSDGKPESHTDADGNNRLPSWKTYQFVRVFATKDVRTGKIDPDTAFSFFIADPKVHGADYQRIIDLLNKYRANPLYRIYNEDEYFKVRNPEAFRIASEKLDLENQLSEKDQKIKDLEAKLGLRNNNNR